MSRGLVVAAEFEQGTLVKVTTPKNHSFKGDNHAYYVPDRARERAGMRQAEKTETIEAYRDDETGFDWDALTELISAIDIAEWADEVVFSNSDGHVGHEPRHGLDFRAPDSDDDKTLPNGIVKFADPEAVEWEAVREPVERGGLWGALNDRILADEQHLELQYQNDTQSSALRTARIPVAVLTEGTESTVAYLAAHDFHNRYIAHAFDLTVETVQEIVEQFPGEQLY